MDRPAPIAQRDLLCTNCAGQCAYDPASGTLACASCGTSHAIEVDPDADPTIEQHYHPDLPHTEQARIDRERPYQCETCGGEVIFHGASLSERCPYCNGALVERPEDESYQTLGLVPFAVPEDVAQKAVQTWVGGRWAAPDDLAGIVAKGRVAGIYVPFWTFDSTEFVKYTVRYRVKSGKRTVTRTRRGEMTTHFDDLLVPASPHVTPLIRDGILHDFAPDSLRPFEPAYLAGFAAERHHLSLREGLRLKGEDKAVILRNRIKAHSGRSRITSVSYTTDTTGIRYRRILLPVWILHYGYGGAAMKVVTCGLKGRTFGERPFSTGKLALMSLVVSCLAVAIGFVWGASQIF
ncbi:hypothetical protein ACS3SW_11265 [Roseobacteraceae bacterium S113]